MSKKLQTYLDQNINFWNKMQGKPEINVSDINSAIAQDIFDSLDADLSPENLHCDGEISASAAMKKYKLFRAAGDQLLVMGYRPTNTYSEFA